MHRANTLLAAANMLSSLDIETVTGWGGTNLICFSFFFPLSSSFYPDPKLCAIPVTPNGHLDPSLPSSNPPVAAGGVTNSSRNSLQPDQIRVAVGSRKSSVMSLGRMTYDQRSLVSE